VAVLALVAGLDRGGRAGDDDRPLITDGAHARHAPVVLPVARSSRRSGAPAFKWALVTVPEILAPSASYSRLASPAFQLVRAARSGRRGARAPPIV
jgi:hypothetical protein